MTGFLVTFKPCGHVQHYNGAPRPGSWASCSCRPKRAGCQTQRQVQEVRACPGCPDCWSQPPLFRDIERAA